MFFLKDLFFEFTPTTRVHWVKLNYFKEWIFFLIGRKLRLPFKLLFRFKKIVFLFMDVQLKKNVGILKILVLTLDEYVITLRFNSKNRLSWSFEWWFRWFRGPLFLREVLLYQFHPLNDFKKFCWIIKYFTFYEALKM